MLSFRQFAKFLVHENLCYSNTILRLGPIVGESNSSKYICNSNLLQEKIIPKQHLATQYCPK
jgi:hypothetical protein